MEPTMAQAIEESRVRLIIFGATGRTGKPLVEQALASGYRVVAFVRDLRKLGCQHERLTVIQGDVTDPAAVEQAISGAEAVISVLATSGSQKVARTRPLTRGMQNILAAMKKHGIRRLIVSASGIRQPGDLPDIRFKLLMTLVKHLVPESYEDTRNSIEVVRASDVDWTVVRMPAPTNDAGTGKVKAGYVNRTMGMRISRSGAAAFMLRELQAGEYLRQAPVVCNSNAND
jgi:putative NADH-flavin reductase